MPRVDLELVQHRLHHDRDHDQQHEPEAEEHPVPVRAARAERLARVARQLEYRVELATQLSAGGIRHREPLVLRLVKELMLHCLTEARIGLELAHNFEGGGCDVARRVLGRRDDHVGRQPPPPASLHDEFVASNRRRDYELVRCRLGLHHSVVGRSDEQEKL